MVVIIATGTKGTVSFLGYRATHLMLEQVRIHQQGSYPILKW